MVAKPPQQVEVADVLGFIEEQRAPRRGGNVVRLVDGEAGLAASTIKRRLATISSFYDYLLLRGICDRNPVPRSINARHRGHRGSPLVRAPKKMPRVLFAGGGRRADLGAEDRSGPGHDLVDGPCRAAAL